MRVLEIGCGEGGVVQAFAKRGCQVTGVELDSHKYKQAAASLAAEVKSGQVRLLEKNIYDTDFQENPDERFDIIVLKDVIEHIHDQPRLMRAMHHYLRPEGVIFFGFPPWYMPFGGHQQICSSKISKLPWLHVLPLGLYMRILKAAGEADYVVSGLHEIWETRITIEEFEHYAKETGYELRERTLYLINPIYQYKFGLKPRKQWKWLGAIPYLRNWFTTCGYYVLAPKQA